eukprot:5356602-Prymnesium_polylepis.1
MASTAGHGPEEMLRFCTRPPRDVAAPLASLRERDAGGSPRPWRLSRRRAVGASRAWRTSMADL